MTLFQPGRVAKWAALGVVFCAFLSLYERNVYAEDDLRDVANRGAEVQDDATSASSSQASRTENEEKEEDAFDYATLFDEPETLKKLDKKAPIWITKDRKFIALGGVLCLRDGPLEFFACRRNSKEHESIFSLDIPPHLIHASLLAIGARQGAPAKYDPEFVPPSGETIEIEARWRDEKTRELRKVRAQELVLENESNKTMSSHWVFTGGLFSVDPDGKKYYLANVTGEVFGVSNFPGSVLDVPFESSSDNNSLCYSANARALPPVGTKVLLVLSRKNPK